MFNGKFLSGFAAGLICFGSYPHLIYPQLLSLEMEDYLERSAGSAARAIALDDFGTVHVAGYTRSSVFPCRNAYQPRLAGDMDAFVAGISPSGSGLLYATYLGGSGVDRAHGIALDGAGQPLVIGMTDSKNFPCRNAYQAKPGGGYDAFVARLSSSGSGILSATYLGGGGDDTASGLTPGPDDTIYVSGETFSADFPTRQSYQASKAGWEEDIFLTRFSRSGSSVIFSTFLGGSGVDAGGYIGLGSGGDIYLAGSTGSDDFPVRNAFSGKRSGKYDAFVIRFDSSGSGLIYSTYLGGKEIDFARGLAVGRDGDAWVTGFTMSEEFPEYGPAPLREGDEGDAFVTGVAPSGSELLFSGCFGTVGIEQGLAIVLDVSGGVYMTGTSNSSKFPLKNPFQPVWGGDEDVFIIKLTPPDLSIAYSTYLGGEEYDRPYGIFVDSAGAVYIAGLTCSFDFPLKKPFQGRLSGWSDGFISKLSPSGSGLVFSTYLGGYTAPSTRKIFK
jgi:Beta-propeller repeat